MGQPRAAIYCRVSTADQNCDRQERDLRDFAERAGYEVVGVFKETASGAKTDRVERKRVMGLAQARQLDAILVTAAASHVPPPLIRQLKPGGRMVIPVGAHFMAQYLLLVTKQADGNLTTRQILPVSFVPLTGGNRD